MSYIRDTTNEFQEWLEAGAREGLSPLAKGSESLAEQCIREVGKTFKVTSDENIKLNYSSVEDSRVIHYDQDKEGLVKRHINFYKGDYIDLSKHSPEQIEHLIQAFDIDNKLKDWIGEISWQGNNFVGDFYCMGIGYHYNDLFEEREEIRRRSEDESWLVRRAVARQGYGLDILVMDESWRVREAAENYSK